ncbi:uncharacterized protein LOC124132616 [Haliotis rufescens]|uniref:uncharacterized protein LOC124132616 n=1 Tax=Haliotis rufescens TaxID=6454 RepID=UPI00201ED88C|nr:uncharacterized protein LOC124132616 [Haliotis rufescens]XP_048248878.1 uncharacterized protein LOC124132616 [Haliotis rufescens]XP_048248880.1 uncharacterized protein LOC124132616 [Haliotis rufescens]
MSVMWSIEFVLVVLANLVVDSKSFHSYEANPFKAENFAPSLSAEKADKVMTEFQEKTDDKLNELEDEIKNSQSLAESKITILETEMKKLANDTKSAVDSQLSSVRKVMDKIAEVCPNPLSIKGGKVLKSAGRLVGAQVQFQCTDGVKLAFTCLATGEWDTKSQCSQTYWENPPLGAYELPSTFGPGSAVTFIAEPLGTGHMWSIFDFKKNGDDKADILLHTSIRTRTRTIVRNSRQNGHYGREERAHLSPFDIKVGQPFNFTAVLDKIGYTGYVNGDHYFDFKHRVKEMPQYVALRGQMKVNSMKVRI